MKTVRFNGKRVRMIKYTDQLVLRTGLIKKN